MTLVWKVLHRTCTIICLFVCASVCLCVFPFPLGATNCVRKCLHTLTLLNAPGKEMNTHKAGSGCRTHPVLSAGLQMDRLVQLVQFATVSFNSCVFFPSACAVVNIWCIDSHSGRCSTWEFFLYVSIQSAGVCVCLSLCVISHEFMYMGTCVGGNIMVPYFKLFHHFMWSIGRYIFVGFSTKKNLSIVSHLLSLVSSNIRSDQPITREN